MKNLLHKKLKAISELQMIRGIALPVGLEFRQLVVTGPPGAGKSHYINQIRGWPNEGYLDLTRKGWWKDQTLVYRPREIHLGLPYKGFKEAMTVFDQEWLDTPADELSIEYKRIRIPPKGHGPLSTNWRDRYIFEFIIPDTAQVYEQRRNREKDGYFPVDNNLSLDMVCRQIDAYSEVALYLHRAGLNVYIRKDIHQAPMLISEKGDVALPPWAVSDVAPRKSLRTPGGWKQLLLGEASIPWFNVTGELQKISRPSRIAHDGKSFDIVLGSRQLRVSPEIPLGASKRYLRLYKNWIITDPEIYSAKSMGGFARIKPGETIIIGRSNKDYDDLFGFSKDIGKKHVSITNTRGDLLLNPLSDEKPVRVIRINDHDNREEIDSARITAMLEARALLGGRMEPLEKTSALALLLEINDILAAEPYRPLDMHNIPGGLLELPDTQIPVVVGDLHGQVNNLLKILTENYLFQALRTNKAILCILGDAVHSEIAHEMEDMESSILMMDLLCSLKRKFPANVFYLRGNHDSFSPDLAKNGIPQGLLMKKMLTELRGSAYVEAMQTFYDRLPYMTVSASFISCHAGPPRAGTTREQIINIRDFPQVAQELTHNRVKRPHYLSGYGKSDIKSLRKVLGSAKSTPIIVGHTPLDPFGSIWQNVGSIKNHHIVYSSHQSGPGFFMRITHKMVPMSYAAEPLLKLIAKMKRTR